MPVALVDLKTCSVESSKEANISSSSSLRNVPSSSKVKLLSVEAIFLKYFIEILLLKILLAKFLQF
ncbi:hypothetical protein RhiirA4_465369 [Rhizophagus irregularis]|uniref:Uncharacterized protein n=1 Tax=Rhizophagus irregularis TaxID=588596 RepID=A0A2I1GRX5_9GLOM|nr:hypothetical protein RhiirA4_465369 [Rhizophagus irregularis]